MGYDRVLRIDHVDVSRPPPPLPFRGQWPPDLDRLPPRGPSDRLDDYHRDADRHERGGGQHGLLRPPNWERMDRSSRDEWESRYSHEQVDRRGVRDDGRDGLLPLPPPPAVRADGPRVKTEEPSTADKTSDAAAPPSGSVLYILLLHVFYSAVTFCIFCTFRMCMLLLVRSIQALHRYVIIIKDMFTYICQKKDGFG